MSNLWIVLNHFTDEFLLVVKGELIIYVVFLSNSGLRLILNIALDEAVCYMNFGLFSYTFLNIYHIDLRIHFVLIDFTICF